MKKLMFVLFAVGVLFTSCGADEATVNKMTDEMCVIMEMFNSEDPMSMIEATGKLTTIADNDEYSKVSESQLFSAMETKCPEGAKKLKDLYSK